MNKSHRRRLIRSTLLIAAAALLIAAASAGPATSAQSGPPALAPDAQSTTGPMPPPGVQRTDAASLSPDAVVISGVPAYIWHHGCGPTAAGMVEGYWDGHGFPDLVPGSAATQTAAVNEMIASEGTASNYTDYCLPMDDAGPMQPDKSEPPAGDEHPDECVADFMKASQSAFSNRYGWSWFSHVRQALLGYVGWVGNPSYVATADNLYYGYSPYLTWDNFRAEIDAGRPVVLLVDTDGNGGTDHFVTAIGYDQVGSTRYYICRDTWDTGQHSYQFRGLASGSAWGIYGAIRFNLVLQPTTRRHAYLPLVAKNLAAPATLTIEGDSLPNYDQDQWSFPAAAGTPVHVQVDTVSEATAFDIEACLSTTSSASNCFVFGDDNMECTYPPPNFRCPSFAVTLPADADGTYYLLIESGSAANNYAGSYGLYRASVTANAPIGPFTLAANNLPGSFR